jgi:hypothetical protein
MLYSKHGSYPKEQRDNSGGWQEVADKPDRPDGKEVVWLNMEWIIRDPKPTETEYSKWKWDGSKKEWVHTCMYCKSKLNLGE